MILDLGRLGEDSQPLFSGERSALTDVESQAKESAHNTDLFLM
jgi:hypothetical protein